MHVLWKDEIYVFILCLASHFIGIYYAVQMIRKFHELEYILWTINNIVAKNENNLVLNCLVVILSFRIFGRNKGILDNFHWNGPWNRLASFKLYYLTTIKLVIKPHFYFR